MAWRSDYPTETCKDELNLTGKWTSPDRDVKQFSFASASVLLNPKKSLSLLLVLLPKCGLNKINKCPRSQNARNNFIAIKTVRTLIEQSIPSLFVTNACHVTNKMTELCDVAAINNPTLVLITESWLDSSILESGVDIADNYSFHCKDRPTLGGGILAYINIKNFDYSPV